LSKAWLSGPCLHEGLDWHAGHQFQGAEFRANWPGTPELPSSNSLLHSAIQTQTRVCRKLYFAWFFVSVRHPAETEELLSSRPNSDSPFKPNVRFAPILLQVDSSMFSLLQSPVGSIRQPMVDLVRNDVVPHVAACRTHQRT
jgi:hypothetical protein